MTTLGCVLCKGLLNRSLMRPCNFKKIFWQTGGDPVPFARLSRWISCAASVANCSTPTEAAQSRPMRFDRVKHHTDCAAPRVDLACSCSSLGCHSIHFLHQMGDGGSSISTSMV